MKKRMRYGLAALVLGVSLMAMLVGCAPLGLGGANVEIDWVDFIHFGGIEYLANFQPGRAIQPNDLGAQFAIVRHTVASDVHDPNYRTQDGDAAFLEKGTPVYRVVGYAPTFRLAARENGKLSLFEAESNPQAKTGADLLDIGGKVCSIIVAADDSTSATLATIAAKPTVDALIDQLLAAPANQPSFPNESSNAPRYWLTFILADGTQVSRNYQPEIREVGSGIFVPTSFVTTLAAAMGT